MDIEIRMDSVQERENCLTVVRGCLATVVAHWERLDEGMKMTLLTTGLDKVEELVRNLERDVRKIRMPSDARDEPRSTTASA